ncbi:MAG: hypothetical protein KME46_16460 [Brasilonema angustatum HA4187-MV1]|nr:hypothetical protein [Brasilonema angustatum HA4187-MV1]
MAQQYLKPENMVTLVVGNQSNINPLLHAASLLSDADRCDYSREAGESDELTEKDKTPLLMSVKKKGRSTFAQRL